MFECNTDFYYEEPDYEKFYADRESESEYAEYLSEKKCDEILGKWIDKMVKNDIINKS